MTTRVDIEDIAATKSEQFLAVVLAAFLLIGSIWFYVEVDDWISGRTQEYTAAEQEVLEAREGASVAQQEALTAVEKEQAEVQFAKDAIDIAEAKGEPVGPAEAAYRQELSEYLAAQKRADKARQEQRATERAARKVEEAHWGPPTTAQAWAIACVRLGFIVLWFVVSLRILDELRSRQSRFLPLGFAAVGTAVVTALVFSTDYITDYIDPLDLGPIVLSVAGAAATIGAFVGLQRWLARRIPGRRVRNSECPFCGHPVRGGAESPGERYCEGCGREVVAPCASCDAPRRVGSPHCAHCGTA